MINMKKNYRVAKGLLLFYNMGCSSIEAEHDTIFSGHGKSPEEMSAKTVKELRDLLWNWDEDLECWYVHT